MERVCEVCGEPIPPEKRADAKVCSRKCREKKYRRTDKGREANRRKLLRYRNTKKGREAKKRADAKYYAENFDRWKSQEHYDRANSNTEARRIMRKSGADYFCVSCKTDVVDLDVHHKDGNWRNNEVENLEYRCSACHNRVHGRAPEISSLLDKKRRVPWADGEILAHLKKATAEIGHFPFTQWEYNALGPGRPTSKTILKKRSWIAWMQLYYETFS